MGIPSFSIFCFANLLKYFLDSNSTGRGHPLPNIEGPELTYLKICYFS